MRKHAHGYKNYLAAVFPKLEAGGCFSTDNVSGKNMHRIQESLDYLFSLPNIERTIFRLIWSGVSIRYKRAK